MSLFAIDPENIARKEQLEAGTAIAMPVSMLARIALLTFVVGCGVTASSEDAPIAPCAPVLHTSGIQNNGIQSNGIQANGTGDGRIAVNGIRLGNAVAIVGGSLQAELSDGSTIDLAVNAIEQDEYELTLDGTNICAPGERGIFVSGIWDEQGARRDSTELVTFSCLSGVIAKCVRWGYDPAKVGSALHQACTRMARADYCGDGQPHTREGTPIDIADTQSIQTRTGTAMTFEAGWGESGAVCVNRPRYAADLPSCWSTLPTCANDDEATKLGALVMNTSSTCN